MAATLIAGGIAYFIGGKWVALGCIAIGLVIAVVLHFTGGKQKRPDNALGATPSINVSPNISPNISPSISPTFNVGVQCQPDQRPKLTFKKWDTKTETMEFWQSGFVLENHGDAALDVKVIRFRVADGVFADSAAIPTISERDEGFALVWIEGLPSNPFHMEKWDLLAAMKRASDARGGGGMYRPDYSIPVSVKYRDFDNNTYMSTSELSYIPARGELRFGPTTQQKLP